MVRRLLLSLSMLGGLLGCASLQPKPQEPTERPYAVREVRFSGGDDAVELAGELTLPHGAGPFPAVVFISGSGPQDRDESLLGHKPFLVLSDHLTRAGFAVLRYDDRGVAKSGGDYGHADREDFARDAAAALAWLRAQPRIDPARAGFLGHSEGGYLAPLASAREAANFLVLLAAPFRPLLPDVMVTQGQAVARSRGAAEADIAKVEPQLLELTDILRADKPLDAIRKDIDAWGKRHGLPFFERRAMRNLFGSRWGQSYANYDPLPAIEGFDDPVLALFGGSDIQVSAAVNAPIARRVLRHPGSRVCTAPARNHLLQPSESGAFSEYKTIRTTIDPAALELIGTWLRGAADAETGEALLPAASRDWCEPA